jgi:asparagine synthase (glutamine-hydrolysing)
LYRAASEQKVRVLLDGHDGDGTVSHGDGRLDELAQAGRWMALTMEAKGLAKVHNQSFRKLVWSYVRRCKLDPVVSRFRVLTRMQALSRALHRRIRLGHSSMDQPSWKAIVNPDFARRIRLAERHRNWIRAQPASAWGERQTHFRVLSGGLQPFALEVFDKAASAFALELRHPFCDKRLVEFCLALPSNQKLHGGWSRIVLRRAMAGFLPCEVQWRVDKTDFLPSFSRGLLVHERERLNALVFSDLDSVKDYIDILALRRLYEHLTRRGLRIKLQQVLPFWSAVSLALWLRYIREKGGAYASP